MIARLVAKEWIEAWRDRRLPVAAAAVLLLVVTAQHVAGREQAAAAERRVEAALAAEREWREQGAANPHSAAHFGSFLYQPLPRLAAFDPGVTPWIGTMFRAEAHVREDLVDRPASDRSPLRAFGGLSAAALLSWLAPLVTLLLGVGMVARDRERGTLALLLSQPVAPRTLLLGKGIAAALLSGAVVLPPFLWSMARSAGPNDGWRLVGLAIAQMLGIACFAGVALLASVRASTRCDALVGSFLIWAASCLALPRLVSEFAAFRHPLPTRDALAAAVREDVRHGIDGHDPQDERRKALEEETLRKHGVAALDELPFNFDALVMNEDERYRSGVYDRHFGAVWDAMEAQERARLVAAIAMPVVAIEHASAVLCDTDLGSARRFNEAAVAWRDQLMYFLNDEMAAKSRTGDWEWKAAPETWARIEPFIAPVRAGREALRAAATPLLWLAIAALAPWLLALRSARRLAP